MRLSVLLAAGSCGILLAACSRKPKLPGDVALGTDPALVTAISSRPVGTAMTSAPAKAAVGGRGAGNHVKGGGASAGAAALSSGRVAPSKKGDEPLFPVRESAGSEIWLSATAPAGAPNNAVFTQVNAVVDTTTWASPLLATSVVGIGASAIGVGALLDVGARGATSADYSGVSQVFPKSLGLGFEGYHEGFNWFGLTPSAPENPHFAPPAWSPPDSYFHEGNPGGGSDGSPPSGGGNPPYTGGDPSHGGDGANQNPPDDHNNDHGWDGGKGLHETPPVTATPEPGSVVLLATGLFALVPVVRRRRRQ